MGIPDLKEYAWEKIWGIWEKLVLKTGYEPKRYWEKRGFFFHAESFQRDPGWQHDLLLKSLREIEWSSLLEVGCGFGRNLKIIRSEFPERKLIGMDISRSMLRQFKKYVNDPSIELHLQSVADATLPIHADVVLTHGLLMHVEPDKIPAALDRIDAFSNRTIICIEQISRQDLQQSAAINPFTFVHPYHKLFHGKNWRLLAEEKKGELGFFLLKKNDAF